MRPVRYLVDTTMRDGEQSPGFAMTAEQKLAIARILDAAGIYQIEAGIPAMSAYETDTIARMVDERKQTKISVWSRLRMDDIQACMQCRPDIIHLSVPVSYVQIYSKLNKNKAWISKNLTACAEYALGRGYEVTVGFEDASRADITFMVALARQLVEMGIRRVRYADTVGVLSPSRTDQAVRDLVENTGIAVEIHAHNDLGMAVANSIMGAKAGADYIDTTILGIGERAGNCDFFKFVHTAQNVFQLGLTRQEALRIQESVAQVLESQLRNTT